MSMIVVKAGIQDTVQDAGRYGYQHLGINPTGAMDRYAMQIANALTGNHPGEGVLELHFPASVFLFTQPALIALTGADFAASINGEAVPLYHPILVGKNDVLHFHKPVNEARVYLSVAGGFAIDQWMNSRSTHLRAGAGGYKGRNLHKDDELLMRSNQLAAKLYRQQVQVLPWQADTDWHDDSEEIFILPGEEWNRLTDTAKEQITNEAFLIAPQSDRMGYRLNNITLTSKINEEMVSSAVSYGTIQLLPDGKLIILMADHQTAGGYPRVAHVITAHHSKLAQMKSGDAIQFRITDPATATTLYLKQQQHLLQLQNACTFRLEQYLHDQQH